MIPENFVKICLVLTLTFFEKLGKIQIFEKVGKNLDKTAEEKLVSFTFSELLGPNENREGETFSER
jgi:hypothetical protein